MLIKPGNALFSTFLSRHNRDLRWYISDALASSANSWAFWIAQTWLIIRTSHGTPLLVAAVTACQFFPLLILGLPGGILADRYSKVVVLVWCDIWVGCLAILSAILVKFDVIRAWHIIAIAVAVGSAAALSQASRQTFPAEVVSEEQLVTAMGLASAVAGVGRVVGPLQAALMLSVFGLSDLLLYIGVALISISLAVRRIFASLGSSPRTVAGRDSESSAYEFLATRPDLVIVMVVMAVVCALGWNSQFMIAMVIDQTFHAGASQFATLTGLFAFGGILGTLQAARHEPPTILVLSLQVLALASWTILTGLAPNLLWFGAALVPLGFSAFQLAVAVNVVFVSIVPGHLRGRLMALLLVTTNGAVGAGAPILGLFVNLVGTRGAYICAGLIIACAVCIGAVIVALTGSLRTYAWLASK